MLQWMFFEQNRHETNIAVLRFWLHITGIDNLSEEQKVQIHRKKIASREILDYMEQTLSAADWFVGGSVSLADVCLYAYTHVVSEIGFDLAQWPHIEQWCKRITQLPGYIPMGT